MIKLDGLEGREFVHGSVDCYTLVRDFYRLNFGLELHDYARPDNWWDPDEKGETLNLYMDNFTTEGFGVVHSRPNEWLPGDLILMAIRSRVANHAGILLPDGQMLHHLYGTLSCVETYNRPIFRDNTMAVIRHPKVDGAKLLEESTIDAMDLIPQRIRDQLDAARQGNLDV